MLSRFVITFICLLFTLQLYCFADETVVHLFGPGIQYPSLAFPSRYIFILHARPIGNVRLITKCRLWTQAFNQTQYCLTLPTHLDASLSFQQVISQASFCSSVDNEAGSNKDSTRFHLSIVRYKVYDEYCDKGFEVQIKDSQDQQILFSKTVKSILRSDYCPCPTKDWKNSLQCSNSPSNKVLSRQIDDDLRPFKEDEKIDFEQVQKTVEGEFGSHPRTYALCLYQVISGEAYRKCYGEYVGFNKFFDEMLLSILRKHHFQNTQFIVNLGDWPLALKNLKKKNMKLPIFSWCGSEESFDIVLPTYEHTESVLHSQGKVVTDILSVFGKQLDFRSKETKLFWRGRDSHRSRLDLIKLSRQSLLKDFYNVSITNFFFFRDEMEEYSSPEVEGFRKHVPFSEFFKYKFQLNIDGSVAAYRFPFLLTGSSLVLKQDSDYYEFFYKQLLPNHHYIPVDESLKDLDSVLEKLLNEKNQPKNEELVWNSRKFVLGHLLSENVFCYYINAIEKYSFLLKDQSFGVCSGCEKISFDSQHESQKIDASKCNCDSHSADYSAKSEL